MKKIMITDISSTVGRGILDCLYDEGYTLIATETYRPAGLLDADIDEGFIIPEVGRAARIMELAVREKVDLIYPTEALDLADLGWLRPELTKKNIILLGATNSVLKEAEEWRSMVERINPKWLLPNPATSKTWDRFAVSALMLTGKVHGPCILRRVGEGLMSAEVGEDDREAIAEMATTIVGVLQARGTTEMMVVKTEAGFHVNDLSVMPTRRTQAFAALGWNAPHFAARHYLSGRQPGTTDHLPPAELMVTRSTFGSWTAINAKDFTRLQETGRTRAPAMQLRTLAPAMPF
jgi:hypothetical protein